MKFELEPYNRGVSKEVLLDDLRKVANRVGKEFLTQEEYNNNGGRFAAATIKKRIGWCKAHELAGLKKNRNYKITREDCINNIKRIAAKLNKTVIRQKEYWANGGFGARIFNRHFGSWKTFVESVGLNVSPEYHQAATDEQLFENIEQVWELLGRQPKTDDFSEQFSKFSAHTYARHFGTLRKALEAFIASLAEEKKIQTKIASEQNTEPKTQQPAIKKHKTPRTVNARLRLLVMDRDNFKCCFCGWTKDDGIKLVIDHKISWDDYGETIMENLQTLCEPCNSGKSNLPIKKS
jgi:5-methylcytosine-specific restriction endonuclease McrA